MEERRELARKAFQHVALYDTAVSKYLTAGSGDTSWPELTFGYNRASDLRYGENPHQKATLYTSALSSGGIVRAERLHGIDMSYTNYLDADAAWRVVSDFPDPAVAIIKHTNPCGLAVHSEQPTAYKLAFEGDSVSAYGGIVGFNRPVSADTARAMRGVLFDIIVAPDYDEDALKTLRRRTRTRILRVAPESGPVTGLDFRPVTGGALIQTPDDITEDPSDWQVVTERAPTDDQLRDLAFAWRACKHIKSNTIVLAKDNYLVGMGSRTAQPCNQRPPRPPHRRGQGKGICPSLRRLLPIPRQHRNGRRGRCSRDSPGPAAPSATKTPSKPPTASASPWS